MSPLFGNSFIRATFARFTFISFYHFYYPPVPLSYEIHWKEGKQAAFISFSRRVKRVVSVTECQRIKLPDAFLLSAQLREKRLPKNLFFGNIFNVDSPFAIYILHTCHKDFFDLRKSKYTIMLLAIM